LLIGVASTNLGLMCIFWNSHNLSCAGFAADLPAFRLTLGPTPSRLVEITHVVVFSFYFFLPPFEKKSVAGEIAAVMAAESRKPY
jgi:hypothetical protein